MSMRGRREDDIHWIVAKSGNFCNKKKQKQLIDMLDRPNKYSSVFSRKVMGTG